jgi:hypothetical protein
MFSQIWRYLKYEIMISEASHHIVGNFDNFRIFLLFMKIFFAKQQKLATKEITDTLHDQPIMHFWIYATLLIDSQNMYLFNVYSTSPL